jgi:hypothetical protein
MLQIIFARDQILPANLKALPAERPKKNGRSYFADLRMTFRQNFFFSKLV